MKALSQPSFSICIPNYNYGRYIGEAIQSVLNQTYQNFEIIVADNASTDDSVEVVKSFKDERIRLIQNRRNIGFAPNLQRVTMEAGNQFVNVLSSDDQMKPDALEVYARVLIELGEEAERTVLCSDVERFNERGEVTSIGRKARDGFYIESSKPERGGGDWRGKDQIPYTVYAGRAVLSDSLRRLKTFAPFGSITYSRTLWDEVEGYNSVRTIGPDKHFNYKVLSVDPTVVYVPLVLYRYREYESDNRAAQVRTLKQPIDDYLYTIEFDQGYLSSLGVSREELIRVFVDQVCIREGLSQLGRRNYSQAFRLFAFALASYPMTALKLPKTYGLACLLSVGPVAVMTGPWLYSVYKRFVRRTSDRKSGGRASRRSLWGRIGG